MASTCHHADHLPGLGSSSHAAGVGGVQCVCGGGGGGDILCDQEWGGVGWGGVRGWGGGYLAINLIQVQRLGGDLHLELSSCFID